MKTTTNIQSVENPPSVTAGIFLRFGTIAISFVLMAIVLSLSAGQLYWAWGWVYLGMYMLSVLINSIFLLRTSPGTVAERGRPKEMQNWDKIVSGLYSLAQFLALPLVAGLDFRFGWTRVLGDAWHIAGAAVFAGGLGLFGWAMITNAFFSTAARIQSDRNQTVCRTGPYRFVRHPGYVGTILQSIGVPFLLGSLWALIPGISAVVLIIIRTYFEDSMLQGGLPGYPDFVREIRFRLLPGIW